MIKVYEWRNTETGEVVEHNHWSEPPALAGVWQRIYSVGIGSVSGGGGSPAKTSVS